MPDPKQSHTNSDQQGERKKTASSTLPKAVACAEAIRAGDRQALARAITWIESTRADYKQLGKEILSHSLPHTGNSLRIAVTGVPGVGKSTFIEAFGTRLLDEGKRVAVLAIDPSSSLSHGSILGDKTRMQKLSQHPDAFIRPSPTSGRLGGVALTTRESMLLCEAAGFDILLIETTGVGQSETAAHSMTDLFLLLVLAGAGDELQGIKRGMMEMADLVAVNKAEPANSQAVSRTKHEIESALSLMPQPLPDWSPSVLTCSSLKNIGIDEVWKLVQDFTRLSKTTGAFENRRASQAIYWMHETLKEEIIRIFYRHPDIEENLKQTEERVKNGSISIYEATTELMRMAGIKQPS
ncbi:MAG: methylmalonyl Co-A mutase-associated GTPase MeaB [Balneolaceae bacterium]